MATTVKVSLPAIHTRTPQSALTSLQVQSALTFESEKEVWTLYYFCKDPKTSELKTVMINQIVGKDDTGGNINWLEVFDIRFVV